MSNIKGIKNLAIVAIAAAGLSLGLSACNGDSGVSGNKGGSSVSLPAKASPEAALQERNDTVLATNSYGEAITAELKFECTGEVSGWDPLVIAGKAINKQDPTALAVKSKFMDLLLGLNESQVDKAEAWRSTAMKGEVDKFKADMNYAPKACPVYQYMEAHPLGF